jgi:hypothetical protein
MSELIPKNYESTESDVRIERYIAEIIAGGSGQIGSDNFPNDTDDIRQNNEPNNRVEQE